MRKTFVTKKKSHKKRKYLFFLSMFLLGTISTFKFLDKNIQKIDNKEFVEILLSEANLNQKNVINKVINKALTKYQNPATLLFKDFNSQETILPSSKEENANSPPSSLPLIYIYNSHQTEEYKASNFVEFSINPTVMMADYIFEDIFSQNNYPTIVEQRSIKDILNKNNWKYNYSYVASRLLMEDTLLNNPTLKYFIDVHRDSLSKDKTTITINDKNYAKTLFLIGLENPNYLENLAFTEKINNKLNEKYPSLSKGILKKGGEGVNGVYNQDFSKYTILIEIGGPENTPTEVLNSSLAFAECFLEVINSEG